MSDTLRRYAYARRRDALQAEAPGLLQADEVIPPELVAPVFAMLAFDDGSAAAVAENQPWSVAEWAVALRFDHPRAAVLVLFLG